MPLILGTNSIKDTGYDVANSCRFQDSDSSEMSRAIASTGSNTTWTVSAWVKRVELGQSSPIFGTGDGNANNDARMVFFDADDKIECSYYNSGFTYEVTTNRLFRDISAWYHICILFDSTQGVAANRIKIYVNGTQETSFATSSYPAEDAAFNFGNTSYTHYVNDMGGRNIRGSHYIAELVYIDGTASAVTNFGEFDEDSPTIWKPKDVSELSVGTNGVYLDFEDSSNLGNAVDGGTDFTESNLDAQNQTTDTPTNNFATLNSLVTESGSTFSEGNCKVVTSSSLGGGNFSTIAASAGKWYAEFKYVAESASNEASISVSDTSHVANFNDGDYTTFLSEYAVGNWGLRNNSGRSYITSSGSQGSSDSQHDGWSLNDIIGVALDCDNNKVYFSKNGGWQDAVDSWGGSSPDSYLTIQADFGEGSYVFGVGDSGTSQNVTWECNFGGTSVSAISSGNADGNGYGNMEYAIPSGYYVLCSKNLAEFG